MPPLQPKVKRTAHCGQFLCVLWLVAQFSARGDVILHWNELMLNAIRSQNSGPTLSSRNLAILHCAVYDAVNAIEKKAQPYSFLGEAEPGLNSEIAAVAAAHRVMLELYPSMEASAESLYENYMSFAPATAETTNSINFGVRVARELLQARVADGSATEVPYIPRTEPGAWRRTPPFFRPPLDPQWRYVDLFALPDTEPFVAPGPPEMGSAKWVADYNQVKELGARSSAVRTAEQSQIATFWSDFSYTAMPPGHWHELAGGIAVDRANSLFENARLFALISMAQADGAIVCWETKFRYNFWRPVTAIQRGDEDGNPLTLADTNWNSFLNSPPFPDYTSGHSTFSKASATILHRFYGTDAISFTARSDSLPGVTRSFTSLAACADEVGMSRIYGGIHYLSANEDGKACGKKIADQIFANQLQLNEDLPAIAPDTRSWDGMQGFRVHGHVSRTCVVERSADLQLWTPALTNTAVLGGFPLATPGGEAGFYRVREY